MANKFIKYSEGKRMGGGDRLPIPAVETGTYAGVCIGFFDVGYHINPKFGKKQRKVVAVFEIDKTIDMEKTARTAENGDRFDQYQGKRHVVSFEETLSFDAKANLRKHLTTWLGGFEIDEDQFVDYDESYALLQKELVGLSALISIESVTSKNTGNTFAKITGLMQLPKGVSELKPENVNYEAPAWIKKKIDSAVDAHHVVQEEV